MKYGYVNGVNSVNGFFSLPCARVRVSNKTIAFLSQIYFLTIHTVNTVHKLIRIRLTDVNTYVKGVNR